MGDHPLENVFKSVGRALFAAHDALSHIKTHAPCPARHFIFFVILAPIFDARITYFHSSRLNHPTFLLRPSGELPGYAKISLHNMPINIRQPKIAPGVTIRQPLMIDAKNMQNRGVQIMNVDRVLGDVHPQLIG